MFALARLELEPLQIIDVAVRCEKTAHRTVGVAIRVIVDADPDRRLARNRELPHEAGALAGKGSLYVSLVELINIVAPNVEYGTADDFLFGLGDTVEKCSVDEPIALLAIHIGERQPERIELA